MSCDVGEEAERLENEQIRGSFDKSFSGLGVEVGSTPHPSSFGYFLKMTF